MSVAEHRLAIDRRAYLVEVDPPVRIELRTCPIERARTCVRRVEPAGDVRDERHISVRARHEIDVKAVPSWASGGGPLDCAVLSGSKDILVAGPSGDHAEGAAAIAEQHEDKGTRDDGAHFGTTKKGAGGRGRTRGVRDAGPGVGSYYT